MKKIVLLLTLLVYSFGYSQSIESTELTATGDWTISATEWSVLESEDSITKIESVKDSLYVYKTVYPNTGVGCLVYHADGICSWNQPRNVRDVYALVDSKMELIETQSPKFKTVIKEIKETVEYWGK